jgi:hypothetical protein
MHYNVTFLKGIRLLNPHSVTYLINGVDFNMAKVMAYSIADKKTVEMLNPKAVKMKNGVWAYTGKSASGRTLYRIVGKDKPTM